MLVVEVVSKTYIQVIHYRTAGKGKAVVCEEVIILDPPIETVEVITYSAKTDMYSAAEAISRARSKIGEEEYHLFNNNCESMVNWALTGEAISKQGDRAKSVLIGVGIAAGIVIAFAITTVGILKGVETGVLLRCLSYKHYHYVPPFQHVRIFGVW